MTGPAAGLLRSSLRRRRKEFVRLAGWSLVQAVPAFLSGWVIARAVDDGFLAGRAGTGFAWLGVLAVAVGTGAWATRHATLGLAAVVEPLRDELVTLVTSGTLRRSAGSDRPADTGGVARLTEQVEIAREAYGAVVMFVQSFAASSVGALLGLATLDPALLLFVLPPLLAGLGLFVGALRAMAARQRDVMLADERVAETASEVTGGLRDVVACGGEDVVRERAGQRIDAAARATRALARMTAVRTASLAVGGWLPLVLVLAGAPWLVQRGVTAGAVLGAVTYVSQGLQPALQSLVRGIADSGLWLLVTLGRITGAAGEPPTEPTAGGPPTEPEAGEPEAGGPTASSPPGRPRHSGVELHGVTFRYARSAEPVIDALDLVLRPDEHLAVVGPSGAGKSTFAALVAGVLAPHTGGVRLGGVPVGCLNDGPARHRVLIPQEAYVFAGSLWENLTYLAPGVPAAVVDAAVDEVGARPLVERLGGYDAAVDQQELSAGERQLVSLVRSYLPPAELFLLDEATCHLDPAAEARAEEAFARRPGTLIVCAHRISSALRADRIMVLDGARAALGTHTELMAGSALYRDLVGHWEDGAGTGKPDHTTRKPDHTAGKPGSTAGKPGLTASPTPGRSGSRRSGSVLRSSE
ncbi:ATP-binding cassette domain-containing protein [Streptomyces ochraceiscleroticus]|uniref:ATP-binding cassette domain-containing protein n=1 Tax=Streptomyces ochraceiscleroticus TaxID=47761 RepID=A0ABW1MJ67_9ACTN|nr:ABC transporter ATP-binding protein [Streptomyces ochraceiscleroticus]